MTMKWFEVIVVTSILVTSNSFRVRSTPLTQHDPQDITTLKYWETRYPRDKEVTTTLPNSFDDDNIEITDDSIVVLSDDTPITTTVPIWPEKLFVREEVDAEHQNEPLETTVISISEYIPIEKDSHDVNPVILSSKPLETNPVAAENLHKISLLDLNQKEQESAIIQEFAKVAEALASAKQKNPSGNKLEYKHPVPVEISILELDNHDDVGTKNSVNPVPEIIGSGDKTPEIFVSELFGENDQTVQGAAPASNSNSDNQVLFNENKSEGNIAVIVPTSTKDFDTQPVIQKVIVRQEEDEDESEEDEESGAQNATSTKPTPGGSPTPSDLEAELPSGQQINATSTGSQTNPSPDQSIQLGPGLTATTSQAQQTTQYDSAPVFQSTPVVSTTVLIIEETTTPKPTTKKAIQGVQEGLIPFVEAFNSQSHQIGLKHRHKLDSNVKIVPVLEKSEYPETPRPPRPSRPPRTTTPRPRTTTNAKPKTTTPTTTTKPPPKNIEQLSFEEEWSKANRIFTMTNIGQGRADCECGKVPFKVDDADKAGVNEYPWTVAIVRTGLFGGNINGGKPHCSGSLINSRFILTTASCVESFYPESIQVWLTALNSLATDNFVSSDFILKKDVKEILMHPNYDRRSNDNDVALIRMISPVDISASSYYVPVCLPAGEGGYDGMFARVVGWTSSKKTGTSNRLTSTTSMCKEDVPVISNTVCNRDTTHKSRVTANQVCAGFLSRLPAETCHMDGGGPLTIPNGGRFTLIGMVSHGHTVRQSYTPIVYSRVGNYADWILHNTQEAEWCSL